MKRRGGLRDLSDDHHGALVLARRARRAEEASPDAQRDVVDEVRRAFAAELEPHFRIEEEHLVPALDALGEPHLAALLRQDHAALRRTVEELPSAPERVGEFGRLLERHVRREEREVFEPTQDRLPDEVLERIAAAWREAHGDDA